MPRASLIASLVASLAAAPTAMATAPHQRIIDEVRAADTLEARAEQTTAAMDILFRVVCWRLEQEDHADVCGWIRTDWESSYRTQFKWAMADTEAMGDHKALSEWVMAVYGILLYYLGEDVLTFLHFDDLLIFNLGIPVAFQPHAEAQWCVEPPDYSCKVEYAEHFVPLAGVSAYWLSWSACMGLTWSGGMFFICSPIGSLTERIVVATVAPRLSDSIWKKNNP